MASTTHGEWNVVLASSRRALAAMSRLTTLLVVGVMLVFSGCNAAPFGGANAGATTGSTSGRDASAYVFFPGTSYQSVDGGAHWAKFDSLLLPRATGHELPRATGYDVSALSPTTRWEALSTTDGRSSVITVACTDDGGRTWQQVTLPALAQPNGRVVALQFLDTTHGWLEVETPQSRYGRDLLFSTQDGGVTWTSIPLPFVSFVGSISFTPASVGWLVGSQGSPVPDTLAWTGDGGKTWSEQSLPLPEGVVKAQTVVGQPLFFDAKNGLIPVNIGQSTVMYATHTGGTIWRRFAEFANATNDYQARPYGSRAGRSAWITVGSTAYVTGDAGKTWVTVKNGPFLFGEVVARSATTAYAITASGMCPSGSGDPSKYYCTNAVTIFGTTDGGQTWTTLLTDVSRTP